MRIITCWKILKYASWISINTINCYCGKYQDSKYKGIVCDTCSVQVAKGGLKKGAFDYILNKLSGKEVYGWNHNMLKGGNFKDFNYMRIIFQYLLSILIKLKT